jgi:hypothetical protein
MDTVSKQKPAILVDWDLYSYSKPVRDYVRRNEEHATLVLLVSDPEHNNLRELPKDSQGFSQDAEWDVVIANTNPDKSDEMFKIHALNVLNTVSNIIPAVAIDIDHVVRDNYRADGILVAMDDTDCANA